MNGLGESGRVAAIRSGEAKFSSFADQVRTIYGDWRMKPKFADFHANSTYLKVERFALCRHEVDPIDGARSPADCHNGEDDYLCVRYNVSGRSLLRQVGNEAIVESGGLTIWESRRPVEILLQDHTVHYDLIVPREAFSSVALASSHLCGFVLPAGSPLANILGAHIAQLGASLQYVPEASRHGLMLATLQLVATSFSSNECLQPCSSRRPALNRVQEYVLFHLRDPDLTPRKIADELGYSTRYIHKVFADSDFTLGQWIHMRRLAASRADVGQVNACRLSIAQIAYKYGFADHSHFTRAFRKAFGESPSDYRKRLTDVPALGPDVSARPLNS